MVYLIFRTLLKRDSSLLEKFIQVYMQHTFYSWFGPSRPLKKHIGFIGEGKKSQKWCRKSSIIGYNWDSRSSSRETRNKLAKPFFRRCAFNQRPMLSDLNGFDKLQIPRCPKPEPRWSGPFMKKAQKVDFSKCWTHFEVLY